MSLRKRDLYILLFIKFPFKLKTHSIQFFFLDSQNDFESRSRTRSFKCCRSVLGSLPYHEQKYLSGTKHLVKVLNSSKTCLMRVFHSPLLMPIVYWKNYRNSALKTSVLIGITEISEDLNISYGSTQHILVKVLGMKRVNARLVPKDLNAPSHSSMNMTDFWPNTKREQSVSHRIRQILFFVAFFLVSKLKNHWPNIYYIHPYTYLLEAWLASFKIWQQFWFRNALFILRHKRQCKRFCLTSFYVHLLTSTRLCSAASDTILALIVTRENLIKKNSHTNYTHTYI